jgi:hypothetical protein
LSTKGLPKVFERKKASHDPRVKPNVERINPKKGPYKNPPISPVTSPGTGAATTCRVWRKIKPMKDRGPGSSEIPELFPVHKELKVRFYTG